MFRRLRGWNGLRLIGVVTLGMCIYTSTAYAAELQSNSYRFEESTIGSGGLMQSSSANYSATDAVGDLSVGAAASANYQVQAGSKTTNDPTLAVKINTSIASFGSFSPTAPSMTTSSFSVLNYTAFGYVVQIEGDVPSNGARKIPALATEAPSEVGKEQYGINLVANTDPLSIGANPDQGEFGFGVADPAYATPNKYHYVNGDIVASAPKSSGVTTFTISYLVNVAPLTQGGVYKTHQTIIVTGTY